MDSCEAHGRALVCFGPNVSFSRMDTLSNARNITSVTLRGQPLSVLKQSQLKQFPHLTELTIEDSELEDVEDFAFEHNPLLEFVRIKSKRLNKVSWRWFQRTNSLTSNLTVDLRDSALDCSCENSWIPLYGKVTNQNIILEGVSRKKPILQYLGLPSRIIVTGCVSDPDQLQWVEDCPRADVTLAPTHRISEQRHFKDHLILWASKHQTNTKFRLSFAMINPNNNRHQTAVSKETTQIWSSEKWVKRLGRNELEVFANVTFLESGGIPEVWIVASMDPTNYTKFPPPLALDMSVILHPQKPHIVVKEEPANKDLVEYRMEISSYPALSDLILPKHIFHKKLPTPFFTTDSYIIAFNVHEFTTRSNSSLTVSACNAIGCSKILLVPNYPKLSAAELRFVVSTNTERTFRLHYRELWLYATLATFVIVTVILSIGSVVRKVRLQKYGERLPLRSSFTTTRTTNTTAQQLVALEDNPIYNRLPTTIKQIPWADVELLDQVGEGAFGIVYEAAWYPESSKSGTRVAAKGLKPEAGRKERVEFEREAIIMDKLSHENIIHLFGVVTAPDLLLIFEFMDQGDLKSYLMCHGPNRKFAETSASCSAHLSMLSAKELLDISWQISNAMTFLAQHHYVHRDVAARNCLVAEPLRVKLGDFGLSRDVYVAQYYKLSHDALLPVRWLAPESVSFGRFTVESDVWSYGILMWEIFSFGELPWSEMDSSSVIRSVKSGQKLPPPQHCPYEAYELMLSCWRVEPAERVKMLLLKQQLSGLKSKYS